MIVQHVGTAGLDRRRRNELQARVTGFDRVVELSVTPVVAARAVEPVLIADLDVGKLERSRVSIPDAHCAPGRSRVAGHVFNLVQRVLYERLKARSGIDVLSAQGVPGEDR